MRQQDDPHVPFDFNALNLQPGDDVMYSSDPSQSDFAYGKVLRVKGEQAQAIDIFVFGHGNIYTQCWHVDDPRIRTHKNRFVHQCHGLFRLTESEIIRKGLVRRMEELEQRIITLDDAICSIHAPPDTTITNGEAVRRRGRPSRKTTG